MADAPHIVFSGINIPLEIRENHRKWREGAYAPIMMKLPGYVGIDYYEIAKKSLDYPDSLSIHHGQDRNTFKEAVKNPDRDALQRDRDATFHRMEWVWHDCYALVKSFRNDPSLGESSIVENAPFVHIEGYRIPPLEQGKFDQWFRRWASRVYIPILMKSPGLVACNCFNLIDLSMRWPGRKYMEVEIPPFILIYYFKEKESFENYEASPEHAALKRSIEVELPNTISAIWYIQYQLMKSFRK